MQRSCPFSATSRLTRLALLISVWMLLGVSSRVHALESSSVVAWGSNPSGQLNVPGPNSGFTAIAAGHSHSLGLKADGSIVTWGASGPVPAPNTGFIAVAAAGPRPQPVRSGNLRIPKQRG